MKINFYQFIPTCFFLKFVAPTFFSILCFSASAQIEGKWTSKETGDVVEIFKENNLFYGKVISAKKEAENQKLKSHTLIILSNFKKESDTEYCCGKIYLPRRKITVDGTMKVIDKNTIRVKGSYGFLSHSMLWIKS